MDAEKRARLFQRFGRQSYDDLAVLPRRLSVKFLLQRLMIKFI
jgi:hypothetical protein